MSDGNGLLGVLLDKAQAIAMIFGGAGGVIVAIVTRSTLWDMVGRIVVGGIVAAAVAPYLAIEVLEMAPTDASYPFVCCSLGVLGYQIVKFAVEHPDEIPMLGRFFSAFHRPEVHTSTQHHHEQTASPRMARRRRDTAAKHVAGKKRVRAPIPN